MNQQHRAGQQRAGRPSAAEVIPPQAEVEGGPQTPLEIGGEINGEAEREAAAQAGHPTARAGARQLDSGS
jgi:hypothetical protein